MPETQYTLWKPEDGKLICLDGTAFTFEELQRQIDACQIDSTWGYSPLGTRQCRSIKLLRDAGRSLDVRPAIALVVSLEDVDDPKFQQELEQKRERLNRRGVRHRVVYRAPSSYHDDGEDYAKTVLQVDPAETWLHDCTSVYLVGDRVAHLLDSDTIARDKGLETTLLTPLRKHCLGDGKTAKPLRYLNWDGSRTHRSLPEDLRPVVNREEVPRNCRVILNRAEKAMIGSAPSPIPLIAMGIITLLIMPGLGIWAWWNQPPVKVFSVAANVLSERDGVYELIIRTGEPSVGEVRLEYPYSCDDPATMDRAWEQAILEARSRKVKESDLPKARPPSRCPPPPKAEFAAQCRYYVLKLFAPNQPVATAVHYESFDAESATSRQSAWDKLTKLALAFGVPQGTLSKDALNPDCPPIIAAQQQISLDTPTITAFLRSSLPTTDWNRIENSADRSLESILLDKEVGAVRNQFVLMSLELDHVFMALHHQVGASKCNVIVLHRTDDSTRTLSFERDVSGLREPSGSDLEAIRNQAFTVFGKQYWQSLIDRSSSLPNMNNINDVYLIGTVPRTMARLLGAENKTIDFLAPTSRLKEYSVDANTFDPELSPEEVAFTVGIMQALLQEVESPRPFASKKKRMLYSPSVEKTFAEKMNAK